jgi:hypothetical protein
MAQMQQSPLDSLINKGLETARQAEKTLGGVKNPGKAVATAVEVGELVLKGGASVSQLDKAVTNLEKEAPGTLKTITELSKTLQVASDMIDPKNVPNALKPLHRDLKDANAKFSAFTEAYDKYQDTKDLSMLNPLNWGKQGAAAIETKQKWDSFKDSWDKLETTALKSTGAIADEAVNKASDILDKIFK